MSFFSIFFVRVLIELLFHSASHYERFVINTFNLLNAMKQFGQNQQHAVQYAAARLPSEQCMSHATAYDRIVMIGL